MLSKQYFCLCRCRDRRSQPTRPVRPAGDRGGEVLDRTPPFNRGGAAPSGARHGTAPRLASRSQDARTMLGTVVGAEAVSSMPCMDGPRSTVAMMECTRRPVSFRCSTSAARCSERGPLRRRGSGWRRDHRTPGRCPARLLVPGVACDGPRRSVTRAGMTIPGYKQTSSHP